jgi:hypothetical protein
VGHTTSFDKRKTAHKNNCYNEKDKKYNLKLYQMIRENGGWDTFKMIEVEKYPCNDRREAERRENEVMKELKANMNTYSSFRTVEEMKEINNEWMIGKDKNGKIGKFPLNYVEKTGESDEKTFNEEMERWELIEKEKVAKKTESIKELAKELGVSEEKVTMVYDKLTEEEIKEAFGGLKENSKKNDIKEKYSTDKVDIDGDVNEDDEDTYDFEADKPLVERLMNTGKRVNTKNK